jgi:hypothetical protein
VDFAASWASECVSKSCKATGFEMPFDVTLKNTGVEANQTKDGEKTYNGRTIIQDYPLRYAEWQSCHPLSALYRDGWDWADA